MTNPMLDYSVFCNCNIPHFPAVIQNQESPNYGQCFISCKGCNLFLGQREINEMMRLNIKKVGPQTHNEEKLDNLNKKYDRLISLLEIAYTPTPNPVTLTKKKVGNLKNGELGKSP